MKKKTNPIYKLLLFVWLIFFGFVLGTVLTNRKGLRGFSNILSLNTSSELKVKDLKKMLDSKNFTFINVHTPYEGEIAKTDLFIEYDSIVANKAKLPEDKNARIVLYCKTGRMSEEALKTLKDLGYKNVSHLKGGMDQWTKEEQTLLDLSKIPDEVLPKEGFALPISWEDLGPRLIKAGVIDLTKFEKAVSLSDQEKGILTKGTKDKMTINSQNSQFVVDLLWAIGLAQKSLVYDEGPMGKEYKATVANFASTGGWTLAKGDAVGYLNKFDLIALTGDEQKRVAEISKNVYRPCCGNSTWFPDCNHGMAALAAIELMVKAGLADDEIYKNVLKLNSFWFSSSYLTTATYFARQGISWKDIDAKKVLGEEFSSGQGAADVAKKTGPLPYDQTSGGGCGA